MWTAKVLRKSGEERPLRVRAVDGRHVTLRDLMPLIREVTADIERNVPWHILDAEIKHGPAPWADPIPLWADRIQGEDTGIAPRVLQSAAGDIGIEAEGHGIEVWHQRTVAVIPIPTDSVQLQIEYEWNRGDPFLHANEEPPSLDARLYAGGESAVLECDAFPDQWNVPREMLHDRQPRFRWLFGISDRAGVLIGRLARRLVRKPQQLVSDPGFYPRLRDQEARIAGSCVRIEAYKPTGAHDELLIVMVHGTFACAVDYAMRLRELCPGTPVVRFEHDTFLPIGMNVQDLVKELRRIVGAGARNIWIWAHSRGGLVACQAASMMRSVCPDAKIAVWTAGTPHHGTPIAGIGGVAAQALGAMYRLCARSSDETFKATFIEGAASYLVATRQMPPGVAAMREGSDFLDLHRLHAMGLDLHTIGGRCNPTGNAGIGHGLLLHPAVAEVFDSRDNDLVVPTESAIMDGSQPMEDCTHFQYFARLRISETPA